MVDPKTRDGARIRPRRWYEDPREESDRPHSIRVWASVSVLSLILFFPFYTWFMFQLHQRLLLPASIRHPFLFSSTMFISLTVFPYLGLYMYVMRILYDLREAPPRVLRRSEVQLFESALVLVSSCWVYGARNVETSGTIAGLIICFKAIPIMNLWCFFVNVGFWDSFLFVLIEAAAFLCRYNGVLVVVVAGVGLALQLVKNVYSQYQSRKIKESTEKLWV